MCPRDDKSSRPGYQLGEMGGPLGQDPDALTADVGAGQHGKSEAKRWSGFSKFDFENARTSELNEVNGLGARTRAGCVRGKDLGK